MVAEPEVPLEKEIIESEPELTTNLQNLFGISSEDDSWSELITPPLDVRVQRLVRLAILLEEGGADDLFKRLPKIAKRLEEWTAERLSRRHASSGNGLLKDAKELGKRLADIPGPGAVMPLSKDVYQLPESDDLQGLEIAINRLENSVFLPLSLIHI